MDAQKKLISILFICFILFQPSLYSQTNYLYKKISCNFSDTPLDEALNQISQKGGFTFSYNSKNFNESQLVSLDAQNKTVSHCINQLFDNSVKYKVVGTHMVLMRKKPYQSKEENPSHKKNAYMVSGYVINSITGEKIKEATIYEIGGKHVTLTNSEGYYSLEIPPEEALKGFSYSKNGYLDTIIIVESVHEKDINIYLKPKAEPINKIESKPVNEKLADMHKRQLVSLLVPHESKVMSENLVIHEKRKTQISLVPYIGTELSLSGSTENNYSFNILSGYTGGVNGFELGGILNIVKRNVNGTQVSGVGNFVGGDTKFFQLAGAFNVNSGSVSGVQVGGFTNIVLDTINGLQLAGFQNTLHGQMNGVQVSGFNNFTTQNVDGVQLTGFANVALKNVETAQVSGFANYGKDINGLQLTGFSNLAQGNVNYAQAAGFANYAEDINGVQLAGFANISNGDVNWGQAAGFANIAKENVNGGQLAGFVNYCKSGGKIQAAGFANIATEETKGVQLTSFLNYTQSAKSFQIAMVNIADTIEKGIPIGLLSFVKKGFHRYEIFATENIYFNTSYKLGHYRFYNIFSIGSDFGDNVYAGYGLGSQFHLNTKYNLNLDIVTSSILSSKEDIHIGNQNRLSLTLDYKFSKHFFLFAGISVNELTTEFDENTDSLPDFINYSFYSYTNSNHQYNFWLGGTIGLSYTL